VPNKVSFGIYLLYYNLSYFTIGDCHCVIRLVSNLLCDYTETSVGEMVFHVLTSRGVSLTAFIRIASTDLSPSALYVRTLLFKILSVRLLLLTANLCHP